MKHSRFYRLTRRFSDGGAQPTQENTSAPAMEQVAAPVAAAEPPAQTAPNYEELLKTDKALQSLFDRQVTKAVQTAVNKDRERMRLLNDAAADEKSKLEVMTPEQRESYWRQKAEKIQKDFQAKEAGRIAKQKATEIFEREKIPLALLDLHDDTSFNDEYTAKLMSAYSQFEFYPKGTFKQAVENAVNEMRKQPAPETHQPQATDPYAWQPMPQQAPLNHWNKYSKR